MTATDFIQIKGRGTRKHDFREQLFDEAIKESVKAPMKTAFKLFDFFANCEYFEEEYNYNQVIKLPPTKGKGGDGGEGPVVTGGDYEHLGDDILATIKEETIGYEGMKIDRMFYEKFEDVVRENDFIAEHLTPTGRAGIIVPEGIIFQSQDAYKILRGMLVENSLVAVVSLPAGCFNPYSGVKTSILILDKSLARQSNTIAFFKVENDGFGLGAQRRAIEKNDLPQVQAELNSYLQAVRSHQPTADLKPSCGLIVPKEKIAVNGDYNLSGERYREGIKQHSIYPHVLLEEIAEVRMGETLIKGDLAGKGKAIYSADTSDEPWAFSEPTRLSFGKNTLVIGARGTIGSVKFPKVGSYAALVKERNDTAHTNGNIFFSTQAALDTKVREILRVVDEIQTHSAPGPAGHPRAEAAQAQGTHS